MLLIQSFFPNTQDLRSNLDSIKTQSLLSCKFLKKHKYTVILYTTEKLKNECFINHPYDDIVSLDLDSYSEIINPKNFWSITKLICAAQQTVPFYHIDTDLFLLEDSISQYHKSQFVTLHPEPWVYQNVKKYFNISLINKIYKIDANYLLSYNFGIFGGQNTTTITNCINQLLNINQKELLNQQIFLNTYSKSFNWSPSVFFEQMVLPTYIQKQEKIVTIVDNTISIEDTFKKLKTKQIIHLWIAKQSLETVFGLEKFCNYLEKYYF